MNDSICLMNIQLQMCSIICSIFLLADYLQIILVAFMNYYSESPPNDEKDRPFICPCGKSYLSYPALFTHIKQKHDGKAPGDVVRPKSQNKRGRPRKMPYVGMNCDDPNEQTEFKSFACRFVLNNQQQKELGFLINQVESSKEKQKGGDFIPPISTSHIAMILTPSNPQFNQASLNYPTQNTLQKKMREIFEPLKKKNHYASSSDIQNLIGLNKTYLYSLEEDRKTSRRPIGCDLWQMDLRTALLEFLDCFKQFLNRSQFRNLEIIVALLIYFYNKQVSQSKEFTTANYVQHLNTFAVKFLNQIVLQDGYNNIFSLKKERPMEIILIIHQWMMEQGLTDFVVKFNDKNQLHQKEDSEIVEHDGNEVQM